MNSKEGEIFAYTPAELRIGKETYIALWAYDPAQECMRRKRYKLNYISSARERKRYGRDLCERLNGQLRNGWNPWINEESSKNYAAFEDAINSWIDRMERHLLDGVLRKATYDEYKSKANNLLRYNRERKLPIRYIYQFDSSFISSFLDHVYIGRKNSAKTYNNYHRVLSIIAKYLLERDYINTDPTHKISRIARNRTGKKQRENISAEHLRLIYDYLYKYNKHYLLACYMEYYCFVRPKELSMLKVGLINFEASALLVPGYIAKNRQDKVVTIPSKVLSLMDELATTEADPEHYLFSDGFRPGVTKRSEKVYRDTWIKMRRELKLPESYHFYSLKDSGVSDMLDSNVATIAVRDQARHSSVSITEIYAQNREIRANKEIKDFEGDF